MPRTPPIILPENPLESSWFNMNVEKNLNDDFDMMRNQNLSPFVYSPSEDNEPSKSSQDSQRKNEHLQYHKPVSSNSSQSKNLTENYELIDDDDAPQPEELPNGTNPTQDDDQKFDSAIDELNTDFKTYTDEYKEFKRQVDAAKRELLEFIQNRTSYFEERGSYIYQKWESLKQFI